MLLFLKTKNNFYGTNNNMFNHSDIWNAIDRLAIVKGYSPSGLAKLAGLDPTTFNKSKRITSAGKLRWPSTESISKILFVTNTPLEEFMTFLNGEAMEIHYNHLPYLNEENANDLENALHKSTEKFAFFPNDKNKHLAFEILSDSLGSSYPAGTILILEIETEHRRKDKLLIHMNDGSFYIGTLKTETSNRLLLDGPENEITIYKDDIDWSARILWTGQ